jgi:hypothetical protein
MARERRNAAYAVEIESAVDEVTRRHSNQWWRALVHQDILRMVGRSGGPRITDDDGNVLSPKPRKATARNRTDQSNRCSAPVARVWFR